MSLSGPFLQELHSEAVTTRRVLERVPESSLAWRPHPKSMSLGQLALHVATLPHQVSGFLADDVLDFSAAAGVPPAAHTHAELMAAFDDGIAAARDFLQAMNDERALASWTLKSGDTQLLSAPRIGVIRSLLFNHWYHHRGQLVVYLRLLDVPVPSVYGPTADENPFAERA